MNTPPATVLMRLDKPRSWSRGVRLVVCGIAAFLNALDMGFQGNGNLIWSGVLLGFSLGLGWSALLLFGPSPLVRNSSPSVKAAVWGICLLLTISLLAIISFHIWAQGKIGIGPL